MTENEIIERLARAACTSDDVDPDNHKAPVGEIRVEPGVPAPWFAPDLISRPWHSYIPGARRFLAMQRAMEQSDDRSPQRGFRRWASC